MSDDDRVYVLRPEDEPQLCALASLAQLHLGSDHPATRLAKAAYDAIKDLARDDDGYPRGELGGGNPTYIT